MTRAAALRMIALLPRYTRIYRPDGKLTCFNAQLTPKSVDDLLRKLMRCPRLTATVKLLDVSGSNVWFVHRSLNFVNLRFMVRNYPKFQHWRRDRLPSVIKYAGKLVIWNGTHRTVTCRIHGVKLRARVIDFDNRNG